MKKQAGLAVAGCLMLLVCVFATSCQSLIEEAGDEIEGAQATVEAVHGVQPGKIPDHFLSEEPPIEVPRQEGDWDVDAYFDVLRHLSVEPGYVLDYLYVYDGMGGYPFIYARPADEPPYTSTDEYAAAAEADAGSGARHDYLYHIQTDGTREGFFELVALRIMADQFYLFWHSGYNDATIVCDDDGLDKLLSAAGSAFEADGLPSGVVRQAKKIDLAPTVEFIDDSTVVVRVITFSKWGGFSEMRFTVGRQFPHAPMEVESETLVEYDCGVSF